jgi:tetratricopeptide (TPR) repeat protein
VKLQNTLIISFISLIILSFNANSEALSNKISACNQALSQGDFATALNVANEILKTDANSREGFLCKGRALGAEGNYSEGLSALEQSEKLSKESLDRIIAYIFIGNLHKKNLKSAEAIASYEKSLKICVDENNTKFSRINYNFIGAVHTQNNDLNAALKSYLAGEKLAMNDNERAENYELLAATYKTLGQYDSAIEYQLKGTSMERISGTLDQYANASLELGKIFTLAKDYSGAEKTLSKFLQFAKENGGTYYEAKANLYLAQNKLASGDLTKAKIYLADARKTAKSVGDKELISEIETTGEKLEK